MSNVNDISLTEKPKIKLSKKSKAAITVVSIIAVIGIIVAVCLANKTALISEVTYIAMPKVIDTNDYDPNLNLVLYAEKNDEFDPKADEKEPLKAFKYYYYDDDGNKVSLNYDDLVFEGTDNEMMACAQFYLEAATKLNSFVKGLKYAAVILAVIVVIVCLALWFHFWSKKYDEEKAELNKNKHVGKNKKKKKKK